jgi:pilus assembly protein Flp/PilA
MLRFIYALRSREDGQALVEYALIVSLIALVAIAALTLTGTNVTRILSSIANGL